MILNVYIRSSRSSSVSSHYSDFDCKVVDYMNQLERQDTVKMLVSNSRQERLVLHVTVFILDPMTVIR